MHARRPPALANRGDFADLPQREPERGRLLDEGQRLHGVLTIEAVAVGAPRRPRQHALGLVEPDCLGGDTHLPRQLADLQPAVHFVAVAVRSSHAWQRAIHASLNPGRSHHYLLTPASRGRLDVRTHCGGGYRPALPRSQALSDTTAELEQILELAIKLKGLVAQEAMHVGARRAPAAANRDDLFDLHECQTEAGRLLDEVQHPDSVVIVESVPVRGALRRRQDPLALIEADRLDRHAGPAGQLSDLEVTTHVTLNLSP